VYNIAPVTTILHVLFEKISGMQKAPSSKRWRLNQDDASKADGINMLQAQDPD